ncbi:MAG: DUF896 domain-containing protein [Ruminococcaceae bacterium]|nr:DUF896 domain-containing protein [Oscillospiraceae bacterium]
MEEIIKRINELAAIAKTRDLTPDEQKERQVLRKKYIDAFKASLTAQLDNVYYVEQDGSQTKLKKKDEA